MRKILWSTAIILIGVSCSTSETESSNDTVVTQSEGFHFSPRHGKENKTISLFKSGETYHLFYSTGSQEWGHAESPNLIHWITTSSIDLPNDTNGDVVADIYNTSGLSPTGGEVWVAVFNNDEKIEAWHTLDQMNWVATPIKLPEDVKGTPKISWYDPTELWIMSVVTDTKINFFSSKDLLSWEQESQYSLDKPVFSAELFSVENNWALLLNGETIGYKRGNFDGSKFESESSFETIDQGGALASATIFDNSEKSILIGQTSENILSSPLKINRWGEEKISFFPVERFKTQITGKRRGKLNLLRGDRSSWFHFPIEDVTDNVELLISNDQGELLRVILDIGKANITIDKTSAIKAKSGTSSEYPLAISNDGLEIDILIDYQQVELFINGGVHLFTIDVKPNNIYDKIDVKVDGEIVSPRTILYTISPNPV